MTTEAPAMNADTQEQRTYVFCPSEPFLTVWVNGRALQFNNGRLVSTHYQTMPAPNGQRHLTAADVDWFRRQEGYALSRGQEPQFLVWDGELDNPITKQVLSNHLREQVMRMCSRKAWAADPTKVIDDAVLTLAQMMATEDGLADVRNMPLPATMRTLERQMPSAGQMLRNTIEMLGGGTQFTPSGVEGSDAAARDAAAIAAAAAGASGTLDELAAQQQPSTTGNPFAPKLEE